MGWIEELASTPEGRRSLDRERFKLRVTENICNLMQKKGITRKEMAGRLDIRKKYFSRMLDGSREIDLNDLADIAEAFDMDVTVDFLMRAKEQPASVPEDAISTITAERQTIAKLLDALESSIIARTGITQYERKLLQQLRDAPDKSDII
jgi:transcriptional regulator with XRE-family HTH domain